MTDVDELIELCDELECLRSEMALISERLRECGFTGFSDDSPVHAARHAISLAGTRAPLKAELERVRAENAKLWEDAERYRTLRGLVVKHGEVAGEGSTCDEARRGQT